MFFSLRRLIDIFFVQVGRNDGIWDAVLEEENLDCDVIAVHSAFFWRMSQVAADFQLVVTLVLIEDKIIVVFLPSQPSPITRLINIVAAFAS